MSNASRRNRKMERFLGYNPDNEPRMDTGEILSDRERSDYLNREDRESFNQKNSEKIGEFIYDFENKTEKFFIYRSRGMGKLEDITKK
jgi:hypothetical protein